MRKIDIDLDTLNFDVLTDQKITIIGYGIQGRAQALNLRDSGITPFIGNIQDKYFQDAVLDKMQISDIITAAQNADIIMLLVPDQCQASVFKEVLAASPADDCLIVVAHGYSIYHANFEIPNTYSIGMLAPRMPGAPIRDAYLKGSGIPAFYDVVKDANGQSAQKLIALAHAIGFTKGGLYAVPLAEETEIDLFIEQFYLPLVIHSARIAHDHLVNKGLNPSTILMELFASGEIGELLTRASKDGLYETWENHASPTCRYGIKRAIDNNLPVDAITAFAEKVLEEIRGGDFNADLMVEGKKHYSTLLSSEQENRNSDFSNNFRLAREL
jgi:ketol-acid reductoisomerase